MIRCYWIETFDSISFSILKFSYCDRFSGMSNGRTQEEDEISLCSRSLSAMDTSVPCPEYDGKKLKNVLCAILEMVSFSKYELKCINENLSC